MPESPMLDTLMFCDTILLDRISKKYSLIGVFRTILSPEFPFTHAPFGVYARLLDVWADQKIRVSLHQPPAPETPATIGMCIRVQEIVVKARSSGRKTGNGIEEIGGVMDAVEFTRPGVYTVVVTTDAGESIGHADLQVVKIERAFVPG